ncbi:MAG TPA: type VI secretion system-associated FHA domain protein TagH [Burkholderiaceae bacterium]
MIKISVISYDNQAADDPPSAVFGPAGGSLGRGTDNTLILPDPKCHISRRQASIKSDGMRHSIMNLSQVSPIRINGKKIPLAADVDLHFGDEIEVGLFLLRAESPFGAASALNSVASNGAFVSPFDIDQGQALAAPAAEEILPVDITLLDAADSAHYADILDAAPATPAANAVQTANEPDVPELNSLFVVDTPKPEPAKAAAAAHSPDSMALTQAFLRGARLPQDSMPAAITPEWMEAMGAFAAAVTNGMLNQLAEPPLRKQEVDPDSTNVLGGSNPLRVLPTARAVMLQMFGAAVPGFMSAAAAIDDACAALRIHQDALKAGMRATLADVLARLDPALLEEQIKTRPVLDSMIAANRKAKCWALYGELFQDVCDAARDDGKLLFGEQFQRAYEEEWKRQTGGMAPKKKSA